MALTIPNLDTKNFSHFVEENRASLPTLAPEWTDYNHSDPGITLLELFSWLSDINIYRLNQINNKHLLAYLKLLGNRPKNVVPSTVWLSFKTVEKIKLDKNSTFVAQPQNSDLLIPFTIERSIQLSNRFLSKISLKNERGNIVYENAKFPIFFYPFGEHTREKSSFTLFFDKEIEEDFSLSFILYEENLPPLKRYDESFYVSPSALLSWSYYDTDNRRWSPLIVKEDSTYTFSISGSIYFEKPTKSYGSIRCLLERGRFENAPRIQNVLTNTIQATQKEKNSKTFSRVGTGLPNQTLKVNKQPILNIETLKVNHQLWQEAESLELHDHHQKVYRLDKITGIIQFGDNVHGMPLPHLATVEINYESSYGANGNITAHAQWSSQTLPYGVEINNYFSAQGGEDLQTIDEAFIAFQKELKAPSQAVTAEDFEYLVLHTPNLRIARAKAYTTTKNQNLVNISVIPFSLQKRPEPSENFRNTICRHLEKHRLITTKIKIVAPLYLLISINVNIKLRSGFNEDETKISIEERIATFLHPLQGWKDGKGWPFGQAVYRSDIYSLLEEHQAVDCITYLHIQAEGKNSSNGNILLEEHELTLSHQHKVSFSNPHQVCRSQYEK